jgi:hypothetical protein
MYMLPMIKLAPFSLNVQNFNKSMPLENHDITHSRRSPSRLKSPALSMTRVERSTKLALTKATTRKRQRVTTTVEATSTRSTSEAKSRALRSTLPKGVKALKMNRMRRKR